MDFSPCSACCAEDCEEDNPNCEALNEWQARQDGGSSSLGAGEEGNAND